MLIPILLAASLAFQPGNAALAPPSPIVIQADPRAGELLQHPSATSEVVQSFTLKGHAARGLTVHNTHGRTEWVTDADGRIFLSESFVRNDARLFVILVDGTKVEVRLRLDGAGGLEPIELNERAAGEDESSVAAALVRLAEWVMHHLVAGAIIAVALALGVLAWKWWRGRGGGEQVKT